MPVALESIILSQLIRFSSLQTTRIHQLWFFIERDRAIFMRASRCRCKSGGFFFIFCNSRMPRRSGTLVFGSQRRVDWPCTAACWGSLLSCAPLLEAFFHPYSWVIGCLTGNHFSCTFMDSLGTCLLLFASAAPVWQLLKLKDRPFSDFSLGLALRLWAVYFLA